jgi:hypothetical protein
MGLDLSGIEAWTRELLDEVARKRGIRNPEFRRRGELVRLLLRRQYGMRLQAGRERVARGVHVAAQVRDLLGKLVSSALEAAPPPLTPPVTPPLSSPPTPPPEEASNQPPPSPARDAPLATTRTLMERPVRTRAAARALAAAGHAQRAIELYAELVERAPDDAALAAEAAGLRRGELPPSPLAAPALDIAHPRASQRASGEDRLTCDGDFETGIALHWRICEAGVRRARAVLGSEGQLTVRLISIEPDPELVVRSTIIEHGPVARQGAWHSPGLPRQYRCLAAVGLLAGTRFVAIVHAAPSHGLGNHGVGNQPAQATRTA